MVRPVTAALVDVETSLWLVGKRHVRILRGAPPDLRFNDQPGAAGRRLGADDDVVGHAGDAGEIAHRAARGLALELPLHFTGQRDPAVLHRHIHAAPGQITHPVQHVLSGARDLGIAAPAGQGQLHLDRDRQCRDAGHACREALGIPLVGIAIDLACEGHGSGVDRDAELRRIDRMVAFQRRQDIVLQLRIGSHR